MSNRVVLHEARRHVCSFQSAARPTRCHVVPRFCPRYQAAPTRAAQGFTQGRVARTRSGCHTRGRTRTRYSQCALNRLATSMKHRSIIREPYQAHASHKAARIGSSYALGRVSVFVSVWRFWRGFHRQVSRRCSFFLREFG